ncbi:MAG TPA: MBL fold metallo-hydrolase [Pseudonocardia sp.]
MTFVPDGGAWLDPRVLFPASGPDGWDAHFTYLAPDGRFPVSIGSFLIQAPGRTILVDLGLGAVDFSVPDLASFRGGQLLESLGAEGLTPSQVDTVFFTHLHHDHVGWTSNVAPAPGVEPGGRVSGLTFDGARHVVAEAEWEYWRGTDELIGPSPTAVQEPLAARLEFAGDGEELAPGVRLLATPGHTPGHSSLVVTDPTGVSDERLVILGDVMHCQVQVEQSAWSFRFDVDGAQGVRTREQLLKELEDPHTILAGGHFAGEVFGRVLPATLRRSWKARRVLRLP